MDYKNMQKMSSDDLRKLITDDTSQIGELRKEIELAQQVLIYRGEGW